MNPCYDAQNTTKLLHVLRNRAEASKTPHKGAVNGKLETSWDSKIAIVSESLQILELVKETKTLTEL